MMELSRRLLIGVAAGGALLFLALSLAVSSHALDASDLQLNAWVERNVGDTVLGVRWSTITAIGASTMATAAVAVAAFLAWRSGSGRTALVIVMVSLAGGLLVDGFKTAYARPYPPHGGFTVVPDNSTAYACPAEARCDVALDNGTTVYCPEGSRCNFYVGNDFGNGTDLEERRVNATFIPADFDTFPTRPGRAYPSGHTMGATVSWGAAILLGARAIQRTRGFDPWAVGIWAALALLGGISRVPVHAHWWTDVVGSWFLGAAILAVGILADDRWGRAKSPERPGDAP